MAAMKGPRKLYRYSAEFKLKAMKPSQIEGVRVYHVADVLEIHPFMLSKWRRDARAGGCAHVPRSRQRSWSSARCSSSRD